MSDMEQWINEPEEDFNPAKAGDDPIWIGGIKYVRADRIEELEAAFANISREYDKRGDRIEELEAKLAKVTAAYRIEVMMRGPWISHEDFDRHIAELTGGKDE